MKAPRCSVCGGPHYKISCFQARRKPLIRQPSSIRRAPIRRRKLSTYKRKAKQSQYRDNAVYGRSERSKLIKEADKIFSIYIRIRRSINNRATCVTCGASAHWKLMQNGHFLSRRIIALRWDEINCNVQCSDCNVGLSGNIPKYKTYLINRYGDDIIDRLRLKMRTKGKTTNDEIQNIIDTYKVKISQYL